MVDVGLSVAKYSVFIVNFLLTLVGLTAVGVAIFIKIDRGGYSVFLENILSVTFYIAIGLGCIIFVISFIGCCGAIVENSCLLFSFSVLMMIAFAIQIAFGVFVFESNDRLEDIVRKGLNDTLYATKNDQTMHGPWDFLQNELKCCGVDGPGDWEPITDSKFFVPLSCCQKPNPSVCLIQDASQEGCKRSFIDFLHSHEVALFGILSGIMLFQILGIVFSCCLFSVFRREYGVINRI